MPDDPIFSIDFTSEGVEAAFVSPDGRESGLAGFDLVDFQAEEDRALDRLVALLAAKARTGGRVRAAALSMPCDLDAGRTKVLRYPQAPWLNSRPLPAILRDALGVPVVMERRSVVMLTYDRAMLGLPEECLAVGCYIDTHYDTAIWHRGGPVSGKSGRAGNIAHMPIHDREDVCFCGKAGCVDLYGAGLRLRQMHSMIFPDTPMEELFVHHGEHPIILEYLRMMGYPIAMEMNIIDPDFLILGGSIPAMPGFPAEALRESILRHAYHPESASVATFLSSVAGMTPGVVCAAQYALGKLAESTV
jgi:allose kinase